MKTHFSLIFWGLLLVTLHIYINNFDLLADGVGYLLIAAGCRGLASPLSSFITAQILCFVLAILWLIGLVLPTDVTVAYGLITMVINCAMIWQLLGGIGEFAESRQRPDLAKQAANRRIAYVAIMVSTSLFVSVMHGSGLQVILLVIVMLILVAMILHLIHRVKVEIAT